MIGTLKHCPLLPSKISTDRTKVEPLVPRWPHLPLSLVVPHPKGADRGVGPGSVTKVSAPETPFVLRVI